MKKIIPEQIIESCAECSYECDVRSHSYPYHIFSDCPLEDYREKPTSKLFEITKRDTPKGMVYVARIPVLGITAYHIKERVAVYKLKRMVQIFITKTYKSMKSVPTIKDKE